MMANLDLSPLFRSSIGFDHMFNLLESAGRVQQVENWPPYDIEKTGEDRYRITMAVAGFSQDELEMTKQADMLLVSGRKRGGEEGTRVLYRGIPTQAFQRRFQLADYVEVARASLVDGLLTIDLVREVPEAMRPKRIPVQTQAAQQDTEKAPQIEQQAA